MKKRSILLLVATHLLVGVVGFGSGIYALPILIAPPAPSASEVAAMSLTAQYSAEFLRDLKGSDTFHWGEGKVSVGARFITLEGQLAPGPDYKLYLSPEFVETEVDFNKLKFKMTQVSDVKTFENFVVEVPANTDPAEYNTVVIWCESFGEFITSAKYR